MSKGVKVGDPVVPHDKPKHLLHGQTIASDSSTVMINGKPTATNGGAISCGGVTIGSGTVNIGDTHQPSSMSMLSASPRAERQAQEAVSSTVAKNVSPKTLQGKHMNFVLTDKQQYVVDFIQNKIFDGNILAGEKFGSESSIAKKLGITRTTVREATRYLVERGVIYKVNGSGLYVGASNESKSKSFGAVSQPKLVDKDKKQEQGRVVTTVSMAIIPVPSVQIAHALRIKPTDKVYYVEQVTSFGKMPVSFEKIHIPVYVASTFDFKRLETANQDYMEEITGKKVKQREQEITAVNLTSEEIAEKLNLDMGQAMIEMIELASFDDGTPFEYKVSTINSDLFAIHQVIMR